MGCAEDTKPKKPVQRCYECRIPLGSYSNSDRPLCEFCLADRRVNPFSNRTMNDMGERKEQEEYGRMCPELRPAERRERDGK